MMAWILGSFECWHYRIFDNERSECSIQIIIMILPIDSASKELQFGSTIVEFGKK